MSALPARLLNLALVAFTVAQVAGALGALFFGRKLQWLWFALAVMTFSDNVVKVALFRETDGLRSLASLAAGLLAALVAIAIHRRFTGIVIAVGGFLAAALGAVQMLGPLLNPAPEWFVFTILIAAGIAGAVWTRTNQATATIVLSAFIGGGVLGDMLVDAMGIDESGRFQVHVVLALIGIAFQFWQERRDRRSQTAPAGGGTA